MRRSIVTLALLVWCSWMTASAKESPRAPARPAASAPAKTAPADTQPAESEPAEPTHQRAETPLPLKARQRAEKIRQLNTAFVELAMKGKFAEGVPFLERILKIDPHNSTAWYNMACVHSRLGDPDEAIDCLKKALAGGYSDFRHMKRDPDIDPLRGLDSYAELLKRNEEIQRTRAEKMRDQLRKRFGAGYIVEVDHAAKLVFATDVDRRTLDEVRSYLTAYAAAQWKGLFTHRFEQYVTVIVPAAKDFGKFAGLPGGRVGGYYIHHQRVLVARQIGMVMTHEFTHALHDADQDGMGQRHPIWVTEGLATLFESSAIDDGLVVPKPNRRLILLRRAVARKQTVPWAQFVKYSQGRFYNKAMICYPQCRYMMMYLYDRGLLKAWYDAYTAGHKQDPTGAEALQAVFKKPLDEIEADWLVWVRKLKPPPMRLPTGSAYIGIRSAGQVDGVAIIDVVPGSGAAKAGLKRGDLIVNIDGERIVESAEVLRLVTRHKPGDEVEVRFRRGGEYMTATVTLGKWTPRPRPRPRARTRPAPRPRPKPKTRPATAPAKKAA